MITSSPVLKILYFKSMTMNHETASETSIRYRNSWFLYFYENKSLCIYESQMQKLNIGILIDT